MKTRIIIAVSTIALFLVSAAIASERAINAYKTHRINSNALIVSCNDEREPVVKKFENTTMVLVSCQSVKTAQ